MPEPLNHQCPECQTGLGVARAVTTVAGRPHVTVVTMACRSCSHKWKVEQQDPVVRSRIADDAWASFEAP